MYLLYPAYSLLLLWDQQFPSLYVNIQCISFTYNTLKTDFSNNHKYLYNCIYKQSDDFESCLVSKYILRYLKKIIYFFDYNSRRIKLETHKTHLISDLHSFNHISTCLNGQCVFGVKCF